MARFDRVFPPEVLQVLSEFGGLHVGRGRVISFGYVGDELADSITTLDELVGETLFPIGNTNIFEDDGLDVLMARDGRVFVDGATGHKPPRDNRIDLIEFDVDCFIFRSLSSGRVPEIQSWYYSLPEQE